MSAWPSWAAAAAVLVVALRFRPGPARCRELRDRSHTTAASSHRPRSAGIGRRLRRPPHDQAATVARWCGDLASSLRAGSALATALDDTDAPTVVADSVAHTVRAVRRGAPLAEALTRARPAHPDAAFAWVILVAVAGHGGPAAEPLDRAAAVLRSRHAERAERRTQSAAARMSARVLTALPIATLCLLVASSGSVRAAVAGPVGVVVVAVGACLNLAGWWWMHRLVERAAR